jgi:type IV pilus assembly protein PilN
MVRINLLPVKVSKKKEAGKQQLIFILLLLLGGLVGNWMWQSNRAADLDTRQKRLNKTKQDIAAIEKIIGEVTSIRAEQKALHDKLDVLETLKRGRSGPVKMLDELATIIPKRVWLKKLNEANGKVSFEGSAGNIEDVSAFMGALKGSTHFKSVELKKTEARQQQGAQKMVDFSIECTVNYGAGPAPAAGG